jgi:hypothetical protein
VPRLFDRIELDDAVDGSSTSRANDRGDFDQFLIFRGWSGPILLGMLWNYAPL